MKISISILLSTLVCIGFSQTGKGKPSDVFVDESGVMRWGNSKEEVKGFGINYTAMFAHAYRAAKAKNISLEQAIDNDIYHFARLGFDFYRIHVWDCEISDSVGNLLDNDHLRLFDFTLAKMKERGMNFIITPIAFWGNGWPQPDDKTPGFSSKYGKSECLTNEDAIKAQEKYLFQFLNHVNPFSGMAYKSDPSMIGFEVSNEPHHGEAPEKVTAYINRMVASMRKTGCKKPILYNISHSIHLIDAYFNAPIQGGTFQWYPTGLGSRHELGGNLLPNVDQYLIPFAENPKFKKGAKIVYEFDAADVGRSYIYPAMARSFREAGMQVAAHFAYDPTYMADVNTEYGTHYMNLAYAPQKALSLKIASAVFHSVPMYKNFGRYPTNKKFGAFQVDYENDLAEMVTDEEFFYTNHTKTSLPNPNKLEHIAGWGNSSIVNYEGTGAYFLDKIETGVWRLEVMPDALWIMDPFERTSPRKEVAVINWAKWPMSIDLADLASGFGIAPLNNGNTFSSIANGKSFEIQPGTYLLTKKDVVTKISKEDRLGNFQIKEFSAPPTSVTKTIVVHKPIQEVSSDKVFLVTATIISKGSPQNVDIFLFGDGIRPKTIPMKRARGYQYVGVVPESVVQEGFLNYFISVTVNGKVQTFPSGMDGSPKDWDFFDENPYTSRVLITNEPHYLFDAATDADKLSRQWTRGSALMPLADSRKAELLVNVEKLFTPDSENKNAKPISDYSIRYFFGEKIKGRANDMTGKQRIILKGRSLNGKPLKIQIALIQKDGTVFGGTITLGTTTADHDLKLSELKEVPLVTLPRPYPSFLPYFFKAEFTSGFSISKAESLQLSIGPGLDEMELREKNGFALESVRLE
jgi:hypothetical protein